VDAGMPTVAQLTKELKTRLPELRDVYDKCRPGFSQAFDLIASYDTSAGENYERFFEWIYLLIKAQTEPFRNLIKINVDPSLIEAMADLTLVIGGEIARLLASRKTEPNYLTRIEDFLPSQGRLKVFSLNYDCCLEDACHNAGIDLTTGFEPDTKKWESYLLQKKSKGINLYKLHGSLRWFRMNDVLMELKPEESQHLPSPELVLGPGSKIQLDDPFFAMLYEFRCSITQTQRCIVIGYSYRDLHINKILDQATTLGINILDVNPGSPNGRYLGCPRYRHLRLSAKDALINGNIDSELAELAPAYNA
jgi:hypothetical protein